MIMEKKKKKTLPRILHVLFLQVSGPDLIQLNAASIIRHLGINLEPEKLPSCSLVHFGKLELGMLHNIT